MAIILYNKKYTETLSVMLDRFRRENPEYIDSKITYAGRLDPMAEGLMILLINDDVYLKEEYLGKDKIYEVDFFFGPETDSLDILGSITKSEEKKEISDIEMQNVISQLKNIKSQQYPHYSSRTVLGKPLWRWAREGQLNKITIPSRSVNIFNAEHLDVDIVSISELHKNIIGNISSVQGDFRQSEIIKSWDDYFNSFSGHESINIYRMRLHVSSGTYVRSLVRELGKLINIPATTLRIKRIQIDEQVLT